MILDTMAGLLYKWWLYKGIYGRALFVLQQFVLSISTTAPAGQIGLNERVAGMVKPSAGASMVKHVKYVC